MKHLFKLSFFALLFLCTAPITQALAQSEGEPIIPKFKKSFHLLFWKSNCVDASGSSPMPECEIPQSVEGAAASVIELTFEEIMKSGSAAMTRQNFKNEIFEIQFQTYSIAPAPSSPYPPHIQIQIHILKPIQNFCMMSLRYSPLKEVPTIICGAYTQNIQERWGITMFQN